MHQGAMTAYEYLRSAIDHIDIELGKGYAKAHPELIGAFMQAAAIDCALLVVASKIEAVAHGLDGLGEALHQVVDCGR
jgi:hypothetical protein